MTEAQLKNLSDEELLRVVDNMMKLDLLALELARRLREALENADIVQEELDTYRDSKYGYCEDANCPYCNGESDGQDT